MLICKWILKNWQYVKDKKIHNFFDAQNKKGEILLKLEIFNKLANDIKENNLVENFMQELSKHIENSKEKEQINTINNEEISNNNEAKKESSLEQQENLEQNREENCLYQVVDFSAKGVFLLNKNTNKIFEETEISQELKSISFKGVFKNSHARKFTSLKATFFSLVFTNLPSLKRLSWTSKVSILLSEKLI